MRPVSLLNAGLCLSLFAGNAFAADACLMNRTMHGWTVPDNRHLEVNANANDKFTLAMMDRCIGLQFAETLAFETRRSSLCVEAGDTISFDQGGLHQSCVITKIDLVKADSKPK